MSLNILYGAPGTGRERRIYEELIRESLAHPERQYIMLVPEQASLTVQEELVTRHPRHALSNIDVLTFRRLAHRIFHETNTEPRDFVDDEGKMLFLQLAVRNKKQELKEIGRNAEKIGTLAALKSMFSEFSEYNVTPEMLREKAGLLPEEDRLRRKLTDLTALYEEFLRLVHERFDLAEEQLGVLRDTIPSWKAAPSVTIAFDGFTGFTPPQYEVIGALMKYAACVIFGFTVGSEFEPKDNKAPEDLFYMPAVAAEKLKELAIRNGVEYREETVTGGEDPRPDALKYAEKHLFAVAEEPYEAMTEAIRVVRGRTFREEIRFAVREIERKVREGCRYRELAVVTGDLAGYREELEIALREAGIPYFMDANKPVGHSALIRFVLDALWVVRDNFAYDAVYSFLKNPILTESGNELMTRDRIAELENFAAARGFRSRSGYAKIWEGGYKSFAAERLPFVNETKDAAVTPLLRFAEKMGKKPTVAERIEALRDLLEAYKADEVLLKTGRTVGEETGEALEKEYASLYRFLMDYLDRAADIIGELTLSTEFFEDLMRAGLATLELRRVPPTKDSLLVGNLTRTRLGNVRHLLVLGANEGNLPPVPASAGFLNDFERKTLKDLNLSIAETAEETVCNARYYLYLLFNEPTESLTLSYATSKNNGEALNPAEILRSVQQLFPKIREENASGGVFPEVSSESSALRELARALRELRFPGEKADPETAEDARALYQWFSERGDRDDALREIQKGLFYRYEKEVIPERTAEALFGEVIRGSVSRLECFATCPHWHFLNYGLCLNPRVVYEINRADLGSIAHESIETFFHLLKEEGKAWEELTEKEQEELVARSVEKVTETYGNEIFGDSARNAFLVTRIRRLMKRTLWALAKQWQSGAFQKTESEVRFEDADFSARHGSTAKTALSGRIDRIDVAEDEGKVFVKIIDYKSSSKTIDFTDVYYGLQLQLLLYMQVALDREQKKHPRKEAVPAGLYYYTVKDPFVADVPDEEIDRKILETLRMSGLTNADPEAAGKIDRGLSGNAESTVVSGLLEKGRELQGAGVLRGEEMKALTDFAVRKAGALAEEIRGGRIEAAPFVSGGRSGCDYCPYVEICGTDRMIRTRKENRLEKKELSDVIGGEDAGLDGQTEESH